MPTVNPIGGRRGTDRAKSERRAAMYKALPPVYVGEKGDGSDEEFVRSDQTDFAQKTGVDVHRTRIAHGLADWTTVPPSHLRGMKKMITGVGINYAQAQYDWDSRELQMGRNMHAATNPRKKQEWVGSAVHEIGHHVSNMTKADSHKPRFQQGELPAEEARAENYMAHHMPEGRAPKGMTDAPPMTYDTFMPGRHHNTEEAAPGWSHPNSSRGKGETRQYMAHRVAGSLPGTPVIRDVKEQRMLSKQFNLDRAAVGRNKWHGFPENSGGYAGNRDLII